MKATEQYYQNKIKELEDSLKKMIFSNSELIKLIAVYETLERANRKVNE